MNTQASSTVNLLLLSVLALAFAQDDYSTSESGLTCFSCNSRYHANCTDGELLEEWQESVEEEDNGSRMRKGWQRCSLDQDVCFLLENVKKNKDGETVSTSVIRGCGQSIQLSGEGNTDECNTVTYLNRERTLCVCEDEYCNGGSVVNLTWSTAIFLIITTLLQ